MIVCSVRNTVRSEKERNTPADGMQTEIGRVDFGQGQPETGIRIIAGMQ